MARPRPLLTTTQHGTPCAIVFIVDAHLIKKLEKLNALTDLGAGRKGVRVSLQFQGQLSERSREKRRDRLHEEFSRIARTIASQGAAVDLESLSVLGQTVEAVLPLDTVEATEKSLQSQHVRVDPLIEHDVVGNAKR